MKRFILQLISFLLLVTIAPACVGHAPTVRPSKNLIVTPIADIVENPQKFADELVTVKGEVSNSMGLFSKSAFTLTDRTGSVTVYCPSSMAPGDGEIVKIRGQVHLLYRFRDNSFCYIKQLKNN